MTNETSKIELDNLYAITVNGQFMDSDANYFGIRLRMSHDMFDSYEDAEKTLKKLRSEGSIGEDEGKVVSVNFTASIV